MSLSSSRHVVATFVGMIASVHSANGFSPLSTSSGSIGSNNKDLLDLEVPPHASVIHAESPTILTIDNLLSEDDISYAMELITEQCINAVDLVDDNAAAATRSTTTPTTTTDYQEDIFRAGAEQEEDSHFASSVDRALASGSADITTRQSIPAQYQNSPLECFLWVITNHPTAVSQDDIVLGANYIKRREARQKWESEGGRQLLDLSMDDEPFEKAGRRYELPREIRDMLVERVVKKVLIDSDDMVDSDDDDDEEEEDTYVGNDVEGVETGKEAARIRWTVQDATVVVYKEGESQVPHVDPCDATLLVYLDDGRRSAKSTCSTATPSLDGGDTCFPMIGCRVPVDVGKVLVFFSSTSPPEGGLDVMSLHHGGRVQCGTKVVAQLMLGIDVGEERRQKNTSWFKMISVALKQ